MVDWVVVALSNATKEIRAYGGFANEDEAYEFIGADLFDDVFDFVTAVPITRVVRVEESEKT